MSYEEAILSLFKLLAVLNRADSDSPESWTVAKIDATCVGTYGLIWDAIHMIAGKRILEHWSITGEVDLTLADRKEKS